MRGKLLNGVHQDSVVNVADDQVVAIVGLLEAHSLQDSQTSVDFGHSGLDSVVIKVHSPEFLVFRVFLHIFDKRGDCLEASFGDTWGADLRIESLDSLDAVLDQLGWGLLVLRLFSGWFATESFAAVPLELLSHASFLSGQLGLLCLLECDTPLKFLLVCDSLCCSQFLVHACASFLVFNRIFGLFGLAARSGLRLDLLDLCSLLLLRHTSELRRLA